MLNWRKLKRAGINVLRVFFGLLGVLVVVVSLVWLVKDPGFDALIGVLSGLAAFGSAVALYESEEKADVRAQERARRDRARVLEHVQAGSRKWTHNPLSELALLELSMTATPDMVTPQNSLLRLPDDTEYDLPSNTTVFDVFETSAEGLLILGEPGAGKSTMLWALANALIVQAKNDETQPIPAIFNLSSWTPKQTIDEWLVDELKTRYSTTKTAQVWVEDNVLRPLFDGLDEVQRDKQPACIEAINTYHAMHGQKVAVCCRREEYMRLKESGLSLAIDNAIYLNPLSKQQIEEYLHAAGPKLAGVREALKQDDELAELVKTPLWLNVIALACVNRSATQIMQTTGETRRHDLWKTYVNRMVKHKSDTIISQDPERANRYLAWLASQMYSRGTEFYIERLQPNWLPKHLHERYRQWSGLVAALGAGLTVGWMYQQAVGLVPALVCEIVAMLVFWLVWTIQAMADITLVEALSFSWPESRVRLMFSLTVGLAIGMTFGLERGLSVGLTAGLAIWVVVGLKGNEVVLRTQPNQGIRRSGQLALLAVLIGGLAIWAMIGLLVGFTAGLATGVVLVILGILSWGQLGGKTVIKHALLRYMLYRESLAPLNYAKFLFAAVDHILMKTDGAKFEFYHRELLDYFADLWEREYAPPEKST